LKWPFVRLTRNSNQQAQEKHLEDGELQLYHEVKLSAHRLDDIVK
jgi:hypothetical protein